ncbi:Rtr1/RPAP2 family-domain-containing protein [Syncephalis fuscata]|nr:Rtr1/RPAP2 family-domain-containing protein [Syncephalis fuscata]
MEQSAVVLEKRIEECEAVTFEWQERLSEPCTEEELVAAAKYLQPRHYQEILEERDANSYCGYPLCDQSPKAVGSKYKIDFGRQIVYDQSSLSAFCSKRCQAASRFYALQLDTQPVHLRDFDRLAPIRLVPMQGDIHINDLVAATIGKVTDPPVVCNLSANRALVLDPNEVDTTISTTQDVKTNMTVEEQSLSASKLIAERITAASQQGKLPMQLVVHERFDEGNDASSALKVRPPSPSRAYTWNAVEGVRLRMLHSKRTRKLNKGGDRDDEEDDDDDDNDDDDNSEEEQSEDEDEIDLDLSTLQITKRHR